MRISSHFDLGNIEVISCSDDGDIQLKIRNDYQSEFYQWFHFRLSGAKGTTCHLQILNAASAAYPPGFKK